MKMSLALIWLLTQNCPWATLPLPPIDFLSVAAYELLEMRAGYERGTTRGLAGVWLDKDGKPIACRIVLHPLADDRILCHELEHCTKGKTHG